MTLAMLETIYEQMSSQYRELIAQKVVENETIRHTNAIELLTSVRLLDQLIKQEKNILARPPGSLGPMLPTVKDRVHATT